MLSKEDMDKLHRFIDELVGEEGRYFIVIDQTDGHFECMGNIPEDEVAFSVLPTVVGGMVEEAARAGRLAVTEAAPPPKDVN